MAAVLVMIAGVSRVRVVSGDDWRPINPEELKMTSEPKAPGAPAIILYKQVDRDDSDTTKPHEYNYIREKIFTEDGRKYADVEIPFLRDRWTISGIKARTIRPDGTVVNFDGKIYEKEIVKARGLKYLAKTFTLTDVQPGSIIEYHYMIDFEGHYVFDSNWVLSEELFTKQAKYTLKPYTEWALKWSWPNNLPAGTNPPVNEHNFIHMDTQDVPAFQVEDDMPPEAAMKYRVDFVYSEDGFEKETDKFWKRQGKKLNDAAEGFVNKRKAMEQAVATIVAPGDTPEVKLQKIYARTQQVRNIGYEAERTEQEKKRAKEKEIKDVEDVWKQGRGDGEEITWLFLGLVRAAGLDASPVMVATRDDHFFNRNMMRSRDLNTHVVLVKLNGKEMYFDPGSAFIPYGLLPWSETSTTGLKLDKDGGTWIQTPISDSESSRIERKADLKLTDEGALDGKLIVTYTGLEAANRRLEERNEDEVNRKKFLEDEVRQTIPTGIEVELTNKPEWGSSASSLVAEYTLKVPGWVSSAGRRAMLPVGLFSAPEKHIFEHSTRVHPLYFHYMSSKLDDVHIQLPLGWQINSLPKPLTDDAKILVYTLNVENQNGTVHVERKMKSELISLEQKYYPALRHFYEDVRTADEEQIVLQPGAAAASN
jgi:hypothetical protein